MVIKTEYKEFIKRRVLKGYSSTSIKKELDRFYKKTHNDLPSICTVERYTAQFKAAARGHSVNPNTRKKTIDEKYLKFIENGVRQSKKYGKIRNELWQKYGMNSVSAIAVFNWIGRIKAALENNSCENRSTSKSSNSNLSDQYPLLLQNDKKQEFLKSRIELGLTVSQIKDDFDREYGLNAPSLPSLYKWVARFKAAHSSKLNHSNSRYVIFRTFVEKGVHEGKTIQEIKRELWNKYGKMSVPRYTVIHYWFHRFKAIAEESSQSSDYPSTSGISNADRSDLESNSESDLIFNSQSRIKTETLEEDERSVAKCSSTIQNDNIKNKQINKSNCKSESNRGFEREKANVCQVKNNDKKRVWFKFKWTNQDAIARCESFFDFIIYKLSKSNFFVNSASEMCKAT